jgi:transcriptional regulator with XRE-family HTH domain
LSKFPEVLRYCRKIQKKSQKEIATLLGVNVRALRNYEHGDREPNIDALIALADYFDVSLDYLVGRSNEPERR